VLREFSNRGRRHKLTPAGRRQVASLAARLADQQIDTIYTSPLLRALESSQVLAQRLGAPVEVAEPLREYDVGTFEGTRSAEHWERYEAVLREWMLAGNRDARTGGGESLTEIHDRFGSFVVRLPDVFPLGGNVVLLAHGGLFRCALPSVLANVSPRYSFEHALDHASWVRAVFREDGSLHCTEWAGVIVPPGGVE
jgi:2,3-bisphosphoglycerate-dependent phosphoglycerate mutase